MDLLTLHADLSRHGLRLRHRNGKVEVLGPRQNLTPRLKQRLHEARDELCGLFNPSSQTPVSPLRGADRWSVSLSDEQIEYGAWDGQSLENGPIALDCETSLVEGHTIPRLALVQVSDGQQHFLVHPDQGERFIKLHADAEVVGHNLAFDAAVLDQAYPSLSVVWDWVEQGRAHDTMLLDMLIRLARRDEYPKPHSLAEVAAVYCKLQISKDDPYRLRYAEIIGKPLHEIDQGFRDYAIKDAVVTWRVWQRQIKIAKSLVRRQVAKFDPAMIVKFGHLTENLQLKAAIALAAIERRGIHIDQTLAVRSGQEIRERIDELVTEVESAAGDGLFKRDRQGELIRSAKSYKPSRHDDVLRKRLEKVAARHDLDIKRTPKRQTISTSTKTWSEHQKLDPFLRSWVQLDEQAKLYQFFAGLGEKVIHPRYTVLVRSGRTSCSNPNIQQLPRGSGFRELVIPAPGHLLLALDYSYIELRTLAAVCLDRFGYSQLAEIIQEGIDPHCYTAAQFEGISLAQFSKLSRSQQKQLRQKAKALNFGIPGLLGAQALVNYAKQSYGVTISEEEAEEFRHKHIYEVYPELGDYLEEDLAANVAENLRTTSQRVLAAFPDDISLMAARKIVRGDTKNAQGRKYQQRYVDTVWAKLAVLNRNPVLKKRLHRRQRGESMVKRIFWGTAVTLTGRIRGQVSFSRQCNTPFQGLAADGAKLALWRLHREGFRTVAFIHDEVLVELPEEADHTALASRVEQIMCESMSEVVGVVPIAVKYSLSHRWYKQAEAVFDDQGQLLVWEPNHAE